MENFFLTEYFDWQPKRVTVMHRLINRAFRELRIPFRTGPYSGGMTTIEQRINLFHFVMQVLVYNVPGDLVELGCYAGHTSVLIQKVLQRYAPERRLHVYDSFEGLPDKSDADGATKFRKGWLSTTEGNLVGNFTKYDLPLPVIHKGWFENTLPTELPAQIAFAHLDGDFYSSIAVSLQYVYPKMSKGAVCVIDDYCDPAVDPHGWNALPGVKKACDEFFADKPERVHYIYSGPYSHGFFHRA